MRLAQYGGESSGSTTDRFTAGYSTDGSSEYGARRLRAASCGCPAAARFTRFASIASQQHRRMRADGGAR